MPDARDNLAPPPAPPGPPDSLDPARLASFLLRQRTRYALAWAAALVGSIIALANAWTWCNDRARRDGNWGHASIDFGGQWAPARMIVLGRGRHLYDRGRLRTAMDPAFPRGDGEPGETESDADRLLVWMVGEDRPARGPAVANASFLAPLAADSPLGASCLLAAGQRAWDDECLRLASAPQIGGALYPPVHALLFAPLGWLSPRAAYRTMQVANLGLVFLGGWFFRELSGGRVWWPVATLLLMLFPGFPGGINLGQNPVLSLDLLLAGWLLMTRGRPLAGGAVWGLLAFKPVWAVAFFPALVLTRRWRAALAMLLSGAALAGLTLPFVGVQGWLDWLAVGRLGAKVYARDETWIFLSRDLMSLPRRWLLDFDDKIATDESLARPLPLQVGLALWLGVCFLTAVVALLRRRAVTAPEGPAAAFVLLGAWLSCYHFMYYDVMLAALPACLLFTRPEQYLTPTFVRPEPLPPELLAYYRPRLADPTPPPVPLIPGGDEPRWVRNPVPLTLVALTMTLGGLAPAIDRTWHFPPFDTFALLLLWAWCGWQTLRRPGFQPDRQVRLET